MTEVDECDEDIIIPSDASVGGTLKKLFGPKIKAGKGNFGIALDRSELHGSVATLLRTVWKSLQYVGSGAMESFTPPFTMRSQRKETPTSLKISITSLKTTSFNLIPPKAYVYLQAPESEIPANEKRDGIIIVPGLLIRIFRLAGARKAPETSKFISIDKKTDMASPKPFNVTMGDTNLAGPLYMDAERLKELVDHDGPSTAMVFARQSSGTSDVGLSDALMRAQGGAYMFILDKNQLLWVVSLEFSPLFAEGALMAAPQRNSPPPPTDVIPPPPKKAVTQEDEKEEEKVQSEVRFKEKLPQNTRDVVNANTVTRDFDLSDFQYRALLNETTPETSFAQKGMIAMGIADALANLSQLTTTISFFTENTAESLKNHLVALIYSVDRDALSMDRTILAAEAVPVGLETNENNFLMASTCLMLTIYLRQFGKQFIATRKMNARVLPTWIGKSIAISQPGVFGAFPGSFFVQDPTPEVKGIFTPNVESVVHAFSVCKYLLAREVHQTHQQALSQRIRTAWNMALIIAKALFQAVATKNQSAEDKTIPSLLHIASVVTYAEAAYFLKESSLSSQQVQDAINRTTNITHADDFAAFTAYLQELWPAESLL